MTNTNKQRGADSTSRFPGSDQVDSEETLFLFAESKKKKVFGQKSPFETWCESFPITTVLKRFGVTATPGTQVEIKNFHLGTETIRIDEQDRYFYTIYGAGFEDEFEGNPQDAYDLVTFFGLGYRKPSGWVRETLNELDQNNH